MDHSAKIYTDQTGSFPVTSNKGNKYILVTYHYDSSIIHAEPLKTRSGLDLTTEYQKLQSLLTNRGLRPHLHILDNECPNILKNFMREVNKIVQLVLPHTHWRKSAEKAIRNFKEHLMSGFSSTHKDFPLHLYCRIIPHAIITLNLLQQLRMNPKNIRVCTTAWRIQLWRHVSSPACYTSDRPWKANCKSHMGIPLSKVLVSRSLDDPLSMPSRLWHQNKRRTRIIFCWVFPT